MKYALLLALSFACRPVSADFVLAFHGPGCAPCAHMSPIEAKLRADGFDIQTVKLTTDKYGNPTGPNAPLAERYKIKSWPQYVRVSDSGKEVVDRILGECTAAKLRKFCPKLKAAADKVRKAVRSLLDR